MRVECRHGTGCQAIHCRHSTAECIERTCLSSKIGRNPATLALTTPRPCLGTVRHLPRIAARVFGQALTEIVRRLDEARAQHLLDQYALIGGLAVAAWGVPRATHGLDFAVALGSADPTALSRSLNARFEAGEDDDPLRGVFQTTVTIESVSIPIQIIILPAAWNAIIFKDVQPLSVYGREIPVVSWQSLVLLKLYAGAPQDLLDAQQILAVRESSQAEKQVVTTLADRVGLSGAWRSLTNP